MPAPLSRRHALGLGAAAAGVAVAAPSAPSAAALEPSLPAVTTRAAADPEVAALEKKYAVRLGLYAVNLRTRRSLTNRADDRFAICSTGKVLAVSTLLHRGTDLDREVRIRKTDLVSNSPVTGERRRMSVYELADAALRYSDNTAMNLMLRLLGGPSEVTRYLRTIGDRTTRLDRYETELNTAIPGDPRDTSTPRVLATTYRTLLEGRALPTDRRLLLRSVMTGNTTSVGKFRAGLPEGWWFADKTGSGDYGSSNDIGIVTAPDGTELLVALMARSTADQQDFVTDPQVFVDSAKLIVGRLT